MAAPATAKRSSVVQFALIFAVSYLLLELVLRTFFPAQFSKEERAPGVYLSAVDATVKGDHHPVLRLENRTENDLVLANRCPMPPVEVFRVTIQGTEEFREPLTTAETAIPCVPLERVPAGQTVQMDLAAWKYSLFQEYGTYDVRLPSTDSGVETSTVTARFEIYEPGAVTKLFRTFITKPLLNTLIFIAGLLPGHNLGVAIIILTLLVKLLLFYPTQKAMKGQREMQLLQPKLQDIRDRYKGDAARLQAETMKLWKEHGVNPLQSCLPTLIQFPILIGLFYTIQDGAHLQTSQHLLYSFHQHLSWSFGTNFLGLDLLKPNYYILPPLLVILQFLQMKLAFARAQKKAASKKIIDVPAQGEKLPPDQNAQQKVMQYGLPFMIGFFALRFPAAVSMYWGISTIFGIAQQYVVNREITQP